MPLVVFIMIVQLKAVAGKLSLINRKAINSYRIISRKCFIVKTIVSTSIGCGPKAIVGSCPNCVLWGQGSICLFISVYRY